MLRASSGAVLRSLIVTCAMALAIAGCGGGSDPSGLSDGAELAAHLPTDSALNIGIVDLDSVRENLGLDARTAPPSGSKRGDLTFLSEAGPALGILQSGVVPQSIVTSLLEGAHSVASVSGDRAATAVSTSDDPAALDELMRSAGLQEDENAVFASEDGTFAIARGDGVVAIAESSGDATSVAERTDGKIPDELGQVDGDGDLVTLARFGANCVDSVATSDTIGEAGEVAFFTTTTPDPDRIQSTDVTTGASRVVGDSARMEIAPATTPTAHPSAYLALAKLAVSYDCGS